MVEDRVRERLKQLSTRLCSADWLDGGFRRGRLYPVARGLMPVGAIKTWGGLEVGAVRSSAEFEDALAGLKV